MPTPAISVAITTPQVHPLGANASSSENVQASDVDFLALLAAYRPSGGIARGGEIAARVLGADPSQLTRQISERSVLSFEWQGESWLPVFQFEPTTPTVKPSIQILVNELSGTLGCLELANWFVQPNTWLDDVAPLPMMQRQFARVHDAARALHYARCV